MNATTTDSNCSFFLAVYYSVARTCGTDTLYSLIHSRPDFIANAFRHSSRVTTSAAPTNNNNSNGGGGLGPSNAQQQQQP